MRPRVAHPADRRQTQALPGADRRRLRDLTVAGTLDSFGMAFGWTVFNLWVIAHGSLTEVGVLNAAMLAGVALSAPATRTMAARWSAAPVLRVTAVTEAVLRIASFALLVTGVWTPVVAVAVLAMNVVGWSGFAAMRAEIAAVDRRARALTRYAAGIGAAEALGAVAAALVVSDANGMHGGALLAVVVLYAGCLVPTFLVAAGARAARSVGVPLLVGMRFVAPLLWSGAAVMVLASGPTLLAVGLAADWYGPRAVAPVVLAAAAGALLAPRLSMLLERAALPMGVTWPLLGAGMIVGWTLAPFHLIGLLVAQLLSGVALAAFEGTMDARVVHRAGAGQITASLAAAASSRAFGSAASVAVLPLVLDHTDIALVAGIGGLALLGAALASSLLGDHAEVHLLPPEPTVRPAPPRV